MTIQWFPGHMYRAKKGIEDLVADIDVVIELLDARSPFASCNPLLQNIIKYKKKIRVLNKSDLADEAITKLWLEFFLKEKNTHAVTGSKDNKKQKKQLIQLCKGLAPGRNSFEKPLRVMIIGIPNVGKSTLINQLVGKKSAKTGDIPAVTKTNQCLTIANNFLIYDTPGMMWQKIEYPQIGYNLAICNSIGRNALDEETLAYYLVQYLQTHYPDKLSTRYKLAATALLSKPDVLISLIAKKRGCIGAKGVIDQQKVSELIIQDFRQGLIGRISLETPELWQDWLKETSDNF